MRGEQSHQLSLSAQSFAPFDDVCVTVYAMLLRLQRSGKSVCKENVLCYINKIHLCHLSAHRLRLQGVHTEPALVQRQLRHPKQRHCTAHQHIHPAHKDSLK